MNKDDIRIKHAAVELALELGKVNGFFYGPAGAHNRVDAVTGISEGGGRLVVQAYESVLLPAKILSVLFAKQVIGEETRWLRNSAALITWPSAEGLRSVILDPAAVSADGLEKALSGGSVHRSSKALMALARAGGGCGAAEELHLSMQALKGVKPLLPHEIMDTGLTDAFRAAVRGKVEAVRNALPTALTECLTKPEINAVVRNITRRRMDVV